MASMETDVTLLLWSTREKIVPSLAVASVISMFELHAYTGIQDSWDGALCYQLFYSD